METGIKTIQLIIKFFNSTPDWQKYKIIEILLDIKFTIYMYLKNKSSFLFLSVRPIQTMYIYMHKHLQTFHISWGVYEILES